MWLLLKGKINNVSNNHQEATRQTKTRCQRQVHVSPLLHLYIWFNFMGHTRTVLACSTQKHIVENWLSTPFFLTPYPESMTQFLPPSDILCPYPTLYHALLKTNIRSFYIIWLHTHEHGHGALHSPCDMATPPCIVGLARRPLLLLIAATPISPCLATCHTWKEIIISIKIDSNE